MTTTLDTPVSGNLVSVLQPITAPAPAPTTVVNGNHAVVMLAGNRYEYKTGNSLAHFAQSNQLTLDQAAKVFGEVRRLAWSAFASEPGELMQVRHSARFNRKDKRFEFVRNVQSRLNGPPPAELVAKAIAAAEKRASDLLDDMRLAAGQS